MLSKSQIDWLLEKPQERCPALLEMAAMACDNAGDLDDYRRRIRRALEEVARSLSELRG